MLKPTISTYGENALLLKWPTVLDAKMHAEILAWEMLLKEQFKNDILDLVVTYAEMALYFKNQAPIKELTTFIQTADAEIQQSNQRKPITWTIPVCYDIEFAWDIELVAEHNKLSIAEVAALHSAQPYRIYFTGFLPGFLYLGGLPEQIVTPRKETPRLRIPKGAVAIGGSQTGIYPNESPGGWRIIGHTPIELFDLSKTKPAPFLSGDFIQFQPVTRDELEGIYAEIEVGAYQVMKGTHR
ncbi:MAG: 5-oxoprolinase subunit PxpB [Crocinitomix sp.]|nr:5-oxoprolinase subunit PxpB [Crocinitomix sp.]